MYSEGDVRSHATQVAALLSTKNVALLSSTRRCTSLCLSRRILAAVGTKLSALLLMAIIPGRGGTLVLGLPFDRRGTCNFQRPHDHVSLVTPHTACCQHQPPPFRPPPPPPPFNLGRCLLRTAAVYDAPGLLSTPIPTRTTATQVLPGASTVICRLRSHFQRTVSTNQESRESVEIVKQANRNCKLQPTTPTAAGAARWKECTTQPTQRRRRRDQPLSSPPRQTSTATGTATATGAKDCRSRLIAPWLPT